MSYRRKKRPNNGIRRLVAFICVAIGFVIIWVGAEFVGNWFVVEPPAVEEPEEPEPHNPLMGGVIEGLPVNPYDLEAFRQADGFTVYDGAEKTQVGIDVSAYQGVIDWEKVASDGIDFAVIRVGYRGYTEGDIIMDEYFEANVKGAEENGIDVGVYFFSQAITPEEAEEEARITLEAIEDMDITYPVVYDWENIPAQARTDEMDAATLTACAKRFCQTVEDAGFVAGIYFNQTYGYQQFNLLELQDYAFWLAQYNHIPDFYYDFQLWQYTDNGTVAGIETSVDLNISFWQP